jgi:YHS domain-containing protein
MDVPPLPTKGCVPSMRYLLLASLLLSACGAVVLAAQGKPEQADAAKKDEGKPVNKFCPIEKDNEIDPKVTTTYEGKVIAFCCAECIDKFKADPKKYMKDLK